MKFLDHFSPTALTLFKSSARTLTIEAGQHLLRRGEPGGDIYLVESGSLQVVDTRSTPEVILAQIEPGDVVGEMAFIDDSPRSADVRASGPVSVLHWTRQDLYNLLGRHMDLSAQFYAAVARMASVRLRQLASTAVSGVMSRREHSPSPNTMRGREDAKVIAERAKESFLEIDTKLRQEPTDTGSHDRLRTLLNSLQDEVNELFETYPDSGVSVEMARLLSRELHPYLVRSALAERCTRMAQGIKGPAEILAHVMVDKAGGDGQLGELIDRWLLDRPTLLAIRGLHQPMVNLVANSLPTHRNRRVLLINAGTGSLVAALNHHMTRAPTTLTVVDQSRDTLAFLDAGLTSRPRQVELQSVQESLAQFAMGRTKHSFPHQDVVIIPGLFEYMPDRIALSTLQVARNILVPNGTVIVSALSPSKDQVILDRLLNWPTIRRRPERLRKIIERADLVQVQEADIESPAMLFAAIVPERTSRKPHVSTLRMPPPME